MLKLIVFMKASGIGIELGSVLLYRLAFLQGARGFRRVFVYWE